MGCKPDNLDVSDGWMAYGGCANLSDKPVGAVPHVSVVDLLSPRGRSSLQAWWAVVLSVAVIEAGLSAWLTGEPFPLNPQFPLATKTTGALVHLALVWPLVAVSLRRARDLGASGRAVLGLWALSELGRFAFTFFDGWVGVTGSIAGAAAHLWIAFGLGLAIRARGDAADDSPPPSQAKARQNLSYDTIDGPIAAWADRHGLIFCTEVGGATRRFCYVSGDEHECFQISVEPPDGGIVAVDAWDVETEDDAELHQRWQVPAESIVEALDAALAQIAVWRSRLRSRPWGAQP